MVKVTSQTIRATAATQRHARRQANSFKAQLKRYEGINHLSDEYLKLFEYLKSEAPKDADLYQIGVAAAQLARDLGISLMNPLFKAKIEEAGVFQAFVKLLAAYLLAGTSRKEIDFFFQLYFDEQPPKTVDLIETLATCLPLFIHPKQSKEFGRAMGTLIGSSEQIPLALCQRLADALDVQNNLVLGRAIYADNSLAITWGASNNNLFEKGELIIGVKDEDGLWSFDKDDAVRVSITSLRNARKAVQNWNGHKLKGQITHTQSERLAHFLGLKIHDGWATVVPLKESKKAAKGFKNS